MRGENVLHRLPEIPSHFQWLSSVTGNYMQRGCNVKRIKRTPFVPPRVPRARSVVLAHVSGQAPGNCMILLVCVGVSADGQ